MRNEQQIIAQMDAEILDLKKQISELEAEIADLNEKNSELEAEIADLNEENSELSDDIDVANERLAELSDDIDEANERLAELESSVFIESGSGISANGHEYRWSTNGVMDAQVFEQFGELLKTKTSTDLLKISS